jgi:hypothetical protein
MINALTGDGFDSNFRTFLRAIDALLMCSVLDKTLSAPPGSPANGDAHIVKPTGTGAWAGHDNAVAIWTTDNPAALSGEWEFYAAANGVLVYNVADTTVYFWNGSAWTGVTGAGAASQAGVEQNSYVYAADTGAANAYVVTLSPVPTIVAGAEVIFKASNANSGASTLTVNGGSAIPIKKNGTTALVTGDITAGQIITVVYDGTNFQIQGGTGAGGGGSSTLAGDTDVLLASPANLDVLTYDTASTKWKNKPAASGFANPMTTLGDLIIGGASGAPARLGVGSAGQFVGVVSGSPGWATPAGGGGGASVPALSSFAWVNQGSGSARQTVSSGPIEIVIPDRGLNWSGLFIAAPSTPYKVTANIRGYQASAASTGLFGLYFYDGTKLEGFEILLQTGGTVGSRVEKIANVTTDSGTAHSGAANSGAVLTNGIAMLLGISSYWLQLRNDGTTIYFDYSIDGANFINFFSEAVGTFITPTKIGVGGLSLTSGANPNVVANLLSWTVAANATL